MLPLFQSKAMHESEFIAFNFSVMVTEIQEYQEYPCTAGSGCYRNLG